MKEEIQRLLKSRTSLSPSSSSFRKENAEGGCGVIGVACEEKIAGKHLFPPLIQMRNRGNGKGGGIAAVGLCPKAFGISSSMLNNDYLLAVAYLDRSSQHEVEHRFIQPLFELHHVFLFPHAKEHETLVIQPPEVVVYFVRVKKEMISVFREQHQCRLSEEEIENELVYQNSYRLNQAFYSINGEKKAFVLSHGKNLLVLKLVGYGDDVIRYYQLEDFKAHVWIGHHRYPTKGKVWHPGGAHPFIGLNEALVHNGDFANYSSICEYLAQRHITPLFLTDTEVAVLVFDLLARTYRYPLEYVIEALAPTTERDFTLLPKEKQPLYALLQKTHIHASPDGPWFFLIAQSKNDVYQLIGITDTSMLRPQVFALQKGEVSIGLAASEKQAIDALLASLSEENSQFSSRADAYWSARGGSHQDGGAFIFTVHPETEERGRLECQDKFGNRHTVALHPPSTPPSTTISVFSENLLDYEWIKQNLLHWHEKDVDLFLSTLLQKTNEESCFTKALEVLTQLIDHHYPLVFIRRSRLLSHFDHAIITLLDSLKSKNFSSYVFVTIEKTRLYPASEKQTVVIDARRFPSEGKNSLASTLIDLYHRGFKRFIVYHCTGQRFIGSGLGPLSQGVQIEVYGSSGDYLGSGIDGTAIHVHGSGQDQLAQIMNDGTLVVHGNVGQTFLYGAKGGKAFVQGHAAGRPLINAVGKIRVVINGTCLDYLAESFMAGDPLQGGGFAIVNGVYFDREGELRALETPYPGNTLFSLASGGAIYLRDPARRVDEQQLNGGEFVEMAKEDWTLILPYLEENAAYFGIAVDQLLRYEGQLLDFSKIYRKITPVVKTAIPEEEAWVKNVI